MSISRTPHRWQSRNRSTVTLRVKNSATPVRYIGMEKNMFRHLITRKIPTDTQNSQLFGALRVKQRGKYEKEVHRTHETTGTHAVMGLISLSLSLPPLFFFAVQILDLIDTRTYGHTREHIAA